MTNTLLRQTASTPLWVDEIGSRVSRTIFMDPQIHAREIERIFNRSWLFLGHESELPNPGDYVTRPMGSDHVIVSRGEDGKIRGFLNACRHRGMPVCRADAGHARRFVCPYHAWTYDTTGALRTTSHDQHYAGTDLSQLGLIPVPQLALYHGLIFGTWDPQASSLDEHLGDLKWYLDILFGRTPGGMTVLAPPQRWIVETNWKIPALNFMDAQHALKTHRGPMIMGQAAGTPPLSVLTKVADATPQLSFPQGHGIALGPSGAGMPEFFGHPPELAPLYKSSLRPEQLKQFIEAPPSVGTIFPNTSWVETLLPVAADKAPTTFLSLRNWQPVGPNKVEIWSWYFAEAEAPPEWRTQLHRTALQTFGMGGIFEEDDAEVWASISRVNQGAIASRQYMDFSAGRSSPPSGNVSGPGTAYPSLLTEQAQFGYIRQWQRMIEPVGTGDLPQ